MKTFIIAEAGVNHNGQMSIAKKLIKMAAIAGADCIKFQTFTARATHTKNAKKAQYQKKITNKKENLHDMIKKLE